MQTDLETLTPYHAYLDETIMLNKNLVKTIHLFYFQRQGILNYEKKSKTVCKNNQTT